MDSERPIKAWKKCASSYFLILAATGFQLWVCELLHAQQRNPTVEIYGLTGRYYFGNKSNVLKGGEWKLQVGGGVLIPVLPKWAVMIDGVTSHLEVNEGPHGPYDDHSFSEFYRVNPEIKTNDLTTQDLVAVLPSFVRVQRVGRLRYYAGGGLGWERQNQHIRYQAAHEQEGPDGSTILVREEEFSESTDTVSVTPLIFRAGILVDVAPRIVLRGGYSHILGYVDTAASKALELGIGFRF